MAPLGPIARWWKICKTNWLAIRIVTDDKLWSTETIQLQQYQAINLQLFPKDQTSWSICMRDSNPIDAHHRRLLKKNALHLTPFLGAAIYVYLQYICSRFVRTCAAVCKLLPQATPHFTLNPITVKLHCCLFKMRSRADSQISTDVSEEHTATVFGIGDEGSNFHRNVRAYLPDYTAPHPTRQFS